MCVCQPQSPYLSFPQLSINISRYSKLTSLGRQLYFYSRYTRYYLFMFHSQINLETMKMYINSMYYKISSKCIYFLLFYSPFRSKLYWFLKYGWNLGIQFTLSLVTITLNINYFKLEHSGTYLFPLSDVSFPLPEILPFISSVEYVELWIFLILSTFKDFPHPINL